MRAICFFIKAVHPEISFPAFTSLAALSVVHGFAHDFSCHINDFTSINAEAASILTVKALYLSGCMSACLSLDIPFSQLISFDPICAVLPLAVAVRGLNG